MMGNLVIPHFSRTMKVIPQNLKLIIQNSPCLESEISSKENGSTSLPTLRNLAVRHQLKLLNFLRSKMMGNPFRNLIKELSNNFHKCPRPLTRSIKLKQQTPVNIASKAVRYYPNSATINLG